MLSEEHWPWLLVASSVAVLHLLGKLRARDDRKNLERIVSRAWINVLDWVVGIVLLVLGLLAIVLGDVSHGLGPVLVGSVELWIAIDRRAQIRRAREILAGSTIPAQP